MPLTCKPTVIRINHHAKPSISRKHQGPRQLFENLVQFLSHWKPFESRYASNLQTPKRALLGALGGRVYFNTRGAFALEFSCQRTVECPVYINRINIICTEELQWKMGIFEFRCICYVPCVAFGSQRPLCCKWHFHGLDTVGVLSSKTLRPQRVWVWPIFRCLKQICKCCKTFLKCFL